MKPRVFLKNSAGALAGRSDSLRRSHAGERGIALVITLILLAVITFMAIAFLVLSSAQRAAVSQTTEQNIAKAAAEAAQTRAMADLMSSIMIATNPFSVGIEVSTNFINDGGFLVNAPARTSVTNVNYYYPNGQLLSGADAQQNIANLLIDPRPPVFIQTNTAGSNDFRFFVDMNRNHLFEPTGTFLVTNQLNQVVPNYFTGDPQWIGGLQFPDRRHSADNQFIYRYAYIVLPASQSLDLNYIYNYSKGPDPVTMALNRGDGFLRNMGAGTYEINLAGFLADLNTNIWDLPNDYRYFANPTGAGVYTLPNAGIAFDDALAILRYRYLNPANNRLSLASVDSLFGPGSPAARALSSDYIDDYSAGPPMTGTWWRAPGQPDLDSTRLNSPWAGADNTNHFFTSQELFDQTKVSSFATNLLRAGMLTNTTPAISLYNRYTFYRLLSQLGSDTDSASDLSKINLNYDNRVRANALGITSSTNFYPWEPGAFFTNTAVALLANAGYAVGTGFNYTNNPLLTTDGRGHTNFQIEVYPINNYTPSVHRLLQLAANIYDSTTNRAFNTPTYPYCPSVFRPIFRRFGSGSNAVVFIVAYREVIGTTLIAPGTGAQEVELDSNPNSINFIPPVGTPISLPGAERAEPLVSGFPLVVGVKKGFPNFNEFAMQTYVNVSRLLEFRRPPGQTDGPIQSTNQMYVATITNTFGVEAWNAYTNTYPRRLQMIITQKTTASMTNEFGRVLVYSPVTNLYTGTIPANTWPGWLTPNTVQVSFNLPFGTNANFTSLTNETYDPLLGGSGGFIPLTHIFDPATRNRFDIPHWFLNLNTRLRYILVDIDSQRIVDYVDLNHWQPTMDLNYLLAPPNTDCSGNVNSLTDNSVLFCTNRANGSFNLAIPTMGVMNQIELCLGLNPSVNLQSYSLDPYVGLDAQKAVDGFRFNLMGWGPVYANDMGKTFVKSNIFYAPLAPFKPVYVHTSWQANDPLVHYTVGDLTDLSVPPTNQVDNVSHVPPLDNLGQPNPRYAPWGGNPFGARSNPTMPAYYIGAKDPFVTRPDYWDFPTNKYPNVGWLGRVHRGTPWQTVYLKSPNIAPYIYTNAVLSPGFVVWEAWSGNQLLSTNYGQISTNICSLYNPFLPGNLTNLAFSMVPDAMFSLPTNDWHILDLFTTTVNQNSERGRLSINQTNLAAWSAVLSGVNVLPDMTTNMFIPPAGQYLNPWLSGIPSIVSGIISSKTNFPNATYQRLGDILATPQLTVSSPFLDANTNLMNDEVVERIPQQILGLLKGGEQPRYVIYSFGQALKPAPHSVLPNGPFFGLCTNYEITAEVATRAVVRIDNATPVPGRPYNPHAVLENFNVLPPD